MNKILIVLMMMLSGMAGAQIVNIPDPVFKNFLIETAGVDDNGDGEIQVSEAEAVTDILITTMATSLEGINAFTNLEFLELNTGYVSTLDITGLVNLETFNGYMLNQLESINMSGLVNLKNLTIRGHGGWFDFSQVPNIEVLDYDPDDLVGPIDLSGNSHLESIEITSSAGELGNLVIGYKPFLTLLRIDIVLGMDAITAIDISGCPVLNDLYIWYYSVASSDLFVNLKNGVEAYGTLNLNIDIDNDSQLYVCVEEGTEFLISEELDNPDAIISSYCSFTPGGAYNTIAANLQFDADNNGCSGTDIFNGFAKVNISDGTDGGAVVNSGGHYNFYTQSGTFTLTPEFESNWFTATPPSATVTLASVDNSTTTQNFCIAANGVHPDVEVVLTPVVVAQPGFNAQYKVVYKNNGNQVLSGAITLNYDDSVLDYVAASPTVVSSTMGTLTWNYTGLLPFESRAIVVTLNLNGPMETPAVNLDDVLAFSASVTPTTGDETPADNTFTLNQVVVGSYDPNDIACLEGHSVAPDKIGEYLHYNINFENTGTAPATFIVVKGMIDETKFDLSSLQLMEASHAVETRINGNKVEFIFDDINLGPEGKGNVVFKIKTLNTLQVNDDVMQQADIFFDYNWPIQTNEATTTFEVLSRGDFAMDNSVMVYPNPAKSIVTISADSNVSSMQLYDIQGRVLQSGTVNDTAVTLDLSSRTAGMYFIKVITEKGMKVEKVVKE